MYTWLKGERKIEKKERKKEKIRRKEKKEFPGVDHTQLQNTSRSPVLDETGVWLENCNEHHHIRLSFSPLDEVWSCQPSRERQADWKVCRVECPQDLNDLSQDKDGEVLA